MASKKKPTAAQLAARAKFTAMVKAKAAARKKPGSKSIAAPKKVAKKVVSKHKDTKSHNVNIRVVSGLDKVTRKGKKTIVNYSRMNGIDKTIAGLQKNYLAIYETSNRIVSDAVFKATSLQEAKRFAQFHKKQTPEISKHKNIRVKVKLYK